MLITKQLSASSSSPFVVTHATITKGHTELECHSGVNEVVRDDLRHLWEVPSIPLLHSHHIDVELLVQIVQQGDGLDDHGVHLVRWEFELISRETVCKTERHVAKILLGRHIAQQSAHLHSNAANQLQRGFIVHTRDAQFLLNDAAEHLVTHCKLLHLVLQHLLLEERLERLAELALHESAHRLHGLLCVGKFAECLEFHTVLCLFVCTVFFRSGGWCSPSSSSKSSSSSL